MNLLSQPLSRTLRHRLAASRKTMGVLVVWGMAFLPAEATVDINVNPDAGRKPISPLIYGTNAEIGAPATAWRQGGNRMTGYNWENNASNAGSDYFYQSDDYLTWLFGVTGAPGNAPGLTVTHFQDEVLAKGSLYSIVTLQLAGYVAKDKSGPVSAAEAAPSSRWVPVSFTKGSAFTTAPNAADGSVYMDEFINFLVTRYGNAASATGVKGYNLDNEPDLWSNTHVRIHPAQPGCAELVTRNTEAAKALKRVDPTAETFGFVSYGFGGYKDFQGAPDWSTERTKGAYRWFVDYYLDQMKQASNTAGTRLLDVLDLHNYTEARGGGVRVNDTSDYTNIDCNKARIQAPRSLWDPNYVEDSWIGQYNRSFLPFLPNIKQSIDTFYPGTKFAMTEYAYGGEGHISGGIAQADVLGIFGKQDVYLATLWPWGNDHTYSAAAFKLYLNYDGAGKKFGNTSVTATAADVAVCSTYAAIEDSSTTRLHVIVLNKSYDTATPFNFIIAGTTQYASARVFAFDAASATITERAAVSGITGNQFSYSLPPLTAAHFVLEANVSSGPVFTTQPSNQTARAGHAVTFSAAASGTPAPTYQWKKDSVNISGATSNTYTILGAVAGDAGSYTVVATNSVSSVTSDPAVLTVLSALSDFNGDGKSDILLSNTATGDRAMWFMNGTAIGTNAFAGTVPTNWVVSGTGDLDGDGKSDIFWTNTTTGDRAAWLMNGNIPSMGGYLGAIPVEWVVSGSGDFNGDGKADIVWTNTTTGERSMWLMNGLTASSGASLGVVPVAWTISGTGDFNGDGKADILLSNTATGDRVIWFMNGATISTNAFAGTVPPAWLASGVGDFDGDGKADIFWTNTTTGDRAAWLMNGNIPSLGGYLGAIPVEWVVSAAGDYNGDGKADILWTNTATGERSMWLMNGLTASSGASLGVVPLAWVTSVQ